MACLCNYHRSGDRPNIPAAFPGLNDFGCDAAGSRINAIVLNAIVFNVARTGGPAVMGVLSAVFGTAG